MLNKLLLALLLTSCILSQQRVIKGCLDWNNELTTCLSCYNRQLTSTGCEPLLPVIDRCLIHQESVGQPQQCYQCKLGFGYTQKGNCVPLDIFNCVDAFFSGVSGKKTCASCWNGQYPSLTVRLVAHYQNHKLFSTASGELFLTFKE